MSNLCTCTIVLVSLKLLLRLVSAFRDKLERLHMKNPAFFRDDYYYNLYGKGIVSAFRKLAVAKFGREAIYSKVLT